MKAYTYLRGDFPVSVAMAKEYEREELLAWAKSNTPRGCPIFLLTDEELAEIGSNPPEAITYDEQQADGYGEAD